MGYLTFWSLIMLSPVWILLSLLKGMGLDILGVLPNIQLVTVKRAVQTKKMVTEGGIRMYRLILYFTTGHYKFLGIRQDHTSV